VLTSAHVSLETDSEGEETPSVMDLYEDYTYNPECQFFQQMSQDDTQRVLNRLKERERRILMYRYQLNGCKRYTLRKIGDKMGISPETVRQIEMKALKEIRRHVEELKDGMYVAAM
jgi:RNA polymerase primary sigma factor